jgi:signal transduction histidine kinase
MLIYYKGREMFLSIGIESTHHRKVLDEFLFINNSFRLAMKNSTLLIFANDMHLRYTWVYSRYPGFLPQDIVGKTDFDIVNCEDAKKIISIKTKVIETGKPDCQQISVRYKGNLLHIKLIIEPIHDNGGIIDGVLCAGHDITSLVEKNRELHKSRAYFIRLADSIAEICFTLNRDMKVTYWGKTLAQLSGISSSQAIGKHVSELYMLLPRRERIVKIIGNTIETGHIARFTYKFSEYIYDFSVYPFASGATVMARKRPQMHCIQSGYAAHREKELKNMAQMIHNTIGQYISALALRCAELLEKSKKGSFPNTDTIENLHKISIDASDALHEVIQSVLICADESIHEKYIIQCLCQTIEKTFGVTVKTSIPGNYLPSDIFERDHIIKFIHEALTNAARHSGMKEIFLKITTDSDNFTCIISDNGCGFEPSKEKNGTGLQLMQFNADELGGDFSIHSDTRGTQISLTIQR